jgi:HSP20 family protein
MFLVPVTRRSSDLARSFDRLFDDTFDRFFGATESPSGARSPALDVAESDGQYTVRLDMPGVAKDDVKISIDGNVVRVEAQARKDSEKKDGERIVYRERSVSSFARSFTLPSEIDEAASSAKLDNGVLTLTLGKRQAEPARRITVN